MEQEGDLPVYKFRPQDKDFARNLLLLCGFLTPSEERVPDPDLEKNSKPNTQN